MVWLDAIWPSNEPGLGYSHKPALAALGKERHWGAMAKRTEWFLVRHKHHFIRNFKGPLLLWGLRVYSLMSLRKLFKTCLSLQSSYFSLFVIFQSRTPLLQSLIGLFELPEDNTIPDEEHFIDIEDTPGYQTAFSQLAFAGKKEHDPVGQMVNNPRIHLAQSLHKLSTACPGRVSVFLVKELCHSSSHF